MKKQHDVHKKAPTTKGGRKPTNTSTKAGKQKQSPKPSTIKLGANGPQTPQDKSLQALARQQEQSLKQLVASQTRALAALQTSQVQAMKQMQAEQTHALQKLKEDQTKALKTISQSHTPHPTSQHPPKKLPAVKPSTQPQLGTCRGTQPLQRHSTTPTPSTSARERTGSSGGRAPDKGATRQQLSGTGTSDKHNPLKGRRASVQTEAKETGPRGLFALIPRAKTFNFGLADSGVAELPDTNRSTTKRNSAPISDSPGGITRSNATSPRGPAARARVGTPVRQKVISGQHPKPLGGVHIDGPFPPVKIETDSPGPKRTKDGSNNQARGRAVETKGRRGLSPPTPGAQEEQSESEQGGAKGFIMNAVRHISRSRSPTRREGPNEERPPSRNVQTDTKDAVQPTSDRLRRK